MHGFNTVDIARRKLIERYDIFRVVILGFKQIGRPAVGFFRQIAAHLHIDSFVTPYRQKVNFFRSVFSYIDLIAFLRSSKYTISSSIAATDFGLKPIMQYFSEASAR